MDYKMYSSKKVTFILKCSAMRKKAKLFGTSTLAIYPLWPKINFEINWIEDSFCENNWLVIQKDRVKEKVNRKFLFPVNFSGILKKCLVRK